MKSLLTTTCIAALAVAGARGAAFSVTPNLVSNDYTGLLTFQMSGLSAGETVQIVQFYDFNGDGVVDGPDLGVRGETITDGQAALVGGATNVNVLADEDGTPNGVIVGSMRFPQAPELARGVGRYLFRFSSPSNSFPVTTVPFTVVSAPYAQKVQGAVTSNGTNVPYAGVALVQIVAGRTKVIVGSTADAAGNYTLPAPPDTYYVIAFWPGYVMDFTVAPDVTLAAGATLTTNVDLIAATTKLSGTLVDNDNPSMPALPYCQITAFTVDHHFTIAVTDSNANFNLPVTPGVWVVRARWQSAVAKSYLVPEPGSFMESGFDTSGGPVTGASVPLQRATALIYGTVEDDHAHTIPGITLSANADGGAFDAFGMSDRNGRYALALDAGSGYVNVEDLSSAPANNYLWSGDYFNTADGQALSLDVTGRVATAYFRGQILDDSGTPVGQFPFFANNNTGGTSLASTDDHGFFSVPVFGGDWQFYPDSGAAQQRGLIFAPYSFQVTDGVNLTNNIIAHRATGQISGYVRDVTNAPVSGLYLTFKATEGATSYSLNAYSGYDGSFSLPVFNGAWTASLGAYDMLSRGYNPANPVTVTVPPTNAVANFILIPIGPASGPPRITTASLPDAVVGQAYSQQLDVTNAATYFSWSLASGALPDGVTLDSFFGSIGGIPTGTGLFNFVVQLTDNRGSNTTSSLSINVHPATTAQAPTLDQPTLLPGNVFRVRVSGVAGQSYTLQFATDVKSWTDLLTTNAPADVFYLQDAQATNASRLYRVRANP